MAKDKTEKKERKEKKEKRSEKDGVSKSKKEKKEKKLSENGDVTTALLNTLENEKPGSVAVDNDGDVIIHVDGEGAAAPVGALVPFANPLADEKATKKVLKSVKKAAKNKSLKRGVKEVVKSLRKSETTVANGGAAPGVVILAADISPMDVISHIPVLCEDHNVPYLYITSRAELGAAGSTKRPTSVVMVTPERQGKKKDGEEGEEDFKEVYQDLVKLVQKESRNVRV
ncbi:L30e-like protein [Xylona heveae TC161]|uniref:H/ACA ribonucleoprotein complex subunit 2 n=1 Tax=Xylona heveae (strain CBS 132557 / TC161) TaxID=1328760 RepID=A0A165HKQ7_XYLHT|nr:L30e-like protein [Xylona heveae TC161]KZF23659.1 L30e-like protein [Xylona heveae TC161]